MGTGIQNVGVELFSCNTEIFAIYSYIQTHRRSCSHKKQRPSILKKDQWTIIVLSFLRRVISCSTSAVAAFPMVERTASLRLSL